METKNKNAVVFGATGLVGSELVKQLVEDPNFSSILVFNRKKVNYNSVKVHEEIVDFNFPDSFMHLVAGDVVFCCLGTTMSKAKGLENYRYIDYELPVLIAKAAKANNVGTYCLVSSIGADKNAKTFYLKTKGETEADIVRFGPERVAIFRPSILLGARTEVRILESISKVIMKVLKPIIVGKFKKYRGIEAYNVAKTMCIVALEASETVILESDRIQTIADLGSMQN